MDAQELRRIDALAMKMAEAQRQLGSLVAASAGTPNIQRPASPHLVAPGHCSGQVQSGAPLLLLLLLLCFFYNLVFLRRALPLDLPSLTTVLSAKPF